MELTEFMRDMSHPESAQACDPWWTQTDADKARAAWQVGESEENWRTRVLITAEAAAHAAGIAEGIERAVRVVKREWPFHGEGALIDLIRAAQDGPEKET